MTTMSQLVEYLGLTAAVANSTVEGIVEAGETVILVTIRPEPTLNFHPHILALTHAQAVRLLDDLRSLLSPVPATQP